MANEKRLIDANALIHDIQHNWDYASVDGITATTVLKQTITDIRNQPTVDAVEVVHGRWIVAKDGNFCNVKCSACGKDYACHFGMLQLHNFDYCPNCGADMRERSEGE